VTAVAPVSAPLASSTFTLAVGGRWLVCVMVQLECPSPSRPLVSVL
jgi:hypothetical protein